MATSVLLTKAFSWEEIFSGVYTLISSGETNFTFDKTINNVEYRIVYSGSALDTNHPVIDRISVTDKQSNAELAFLRRYNYEVGVGIEADPGITRSVEELQSGGFASFEHLMKSGGMTCEQFGSDQADIMIGFTSDLENLWGMDGDDTLIGGVGEELLWGEDGFDYASYETASGGVLVSLNGNPALNTGVAYWDRFYSIEGLIGSAQDDHLIGDRAKNHLLGGNGDDTLSGSHEYEWQFGVRGHDTLDGGSGIDTAQFRFDRADYDIVYVGGYWGITDRTADRDGTALITNIEFLQFADERIAAPTGPEPIYGTSDADTLTGTSGADTIYGHGRDSTEDTGDTLDGAGGNDTIHGGGGDDTIYGGADSDQIYGDAGNDQLRGGNAAGIDESADTLTGGAGDDTYYVSSGDTVVELAGEVQGTDEVRATESFTLGAGQAVEVLRAWPADSDTAIDLTGNELAQRLIGNAGANILNGGGGADTLEGGDGADSLEGGTGDDTYIIGAGGIIVEEANEGFDTVRATQSYTLGANLENLTLIGTAARGTGNNLNNVILGNGEANTLDGGDGMDTLTGGAGDDVYYVDSRDRVAELVDEGTDEVHTSVSFDLAAGRAGGAATSLAAEAVYEDEGSLENLTLLGDSTINGIGNRLANRITGNSAANSLDGAAGSDTLFGEGGADTLKGGTGADDLQGGSGNDTYRIDDPNDEITEADTGDIDTLISSVSYTLAGASHVEILRVDGAATISLTGNGFANTFHGNGANNTFDGRGGQDKVVLTGQRSDYEITLKDEVLTIKDKRTNGDGTDTVTGAEIFKFSDGEISFQNILNNAPSAVKLIGDVIEENSKTGDRIGQLSVTDEATDKHQFALDDNAGGRFSLDADGTLRVANGVLLDYEQAQKHTIAVTVTDSLGKKHTQRIDVTVGDSQAEQAVGSALADVIKGGYGNDMLSGVGGDDVLSSGIGNDRLIGGLGKDALTGGTGRDVFVFDDRDTGSSKTKADTITDFSGRQGDRLDLKLVDANMSKRGDQKFSFIGKNAFSKAGEVRYEKTKKDTYVYLNTDNDKAAEAVIKLKGSLDLQKGWFVL